MSAPDGIAVVGMAVLLPSAPDLETYWHNLVHGVDAITEVPRHRWDEEFYAPGGRSGRASADRIYCRRGGFVDELAEVEVTRFGITPMSVEGTEPDQLIALSVAARAIEDAGGPDRLPAPERVGVILGRGGYVAPAGVRLSNRVRGGRQLVKTLRELLPEVPDDVVDRLRKGYEAQLGEQRPENAIGLVSNLSASRIANRLDLRGPAYTVDGACASSLLAIDQGASELLRHRCDAVVVGGVHHVHDISFWSVFNQLRALSPSEQIRPFSQRADGTLIGEGTGVVVLKRLADAHRDEDRIYAVIRGIGVGSDGRSSSLMNPDPQAQARVMRDAWAQAGVDPLAPGSVGLIEAHGTATAVGDQAELTSLAAVFGPHRDGDRPVVGTVKSMIGHTMPAAGVAGLVKAALALHHRILPPTLNCPDPHQLMAEGRFRVTDRALEWSAEEGAPPRRAGVNAFGFGGINAHIVLEEPPGRQGSRGAVWPSRTERVTVVEADQILRLTADTPAQLRQVLAGTPQDIRKASLDEHIDGRAGSRLAVLDPSPRRLDLARRIVADGKDWQGVDDVWFAPRPLLRPGGAQIAFVFPGLDSAGPATMDTLADRLGRRRTRTGYGPLVDQALDVVHSGEVLDTALRRLGIAPAVVCGPSLGQWSSLISAGVIDIDDVRGCLYRFEEFATALAAAEQSATGASALIAAPAASLVPLLARFPDVSITHENSPKQSVICGPRPVLEQILAGYRARGVAGRLIGVPPAFHSRWLEPYREMLARSIATVPVAPAGATVWSAAHVAPAPPTVTPAHFHRLLLDSLLLPVRFRQLTEALYRSGVRAFVHIGPLGLGNAIGDTLQGHEHLRVDAASARRPAEIQLRAVIAALWAYGENRYGRDDQARRLLEPAGGRGAVRLDLGAPLISLDGRTTEQFRRSLPGRRPVSQKPVALRPARQVLRVSTEEMPYLLDHCFFRQRPDWPEEEDRWPVVPGTTIVAHLTQLAEAGNPGLVTTEVQDIRLLEWLPAAPGLQVPVEATVAGPDLLDVRVGPHAQARVRLSAAYPSPPARWPMAPERPLDLTAESLYEGRMMFHGKQFQGVTDLLGIGEKHIRAALVVPPAPGSLLDNVGQVFGVWIIVNHPDRSHVLPVRISSIQWFAPHPKPGTQVECQVRIVSVSEDWVVCEAQLSVAGRVIAQIGGWRDRRFDLDRRAQAALCFPEYETLSIPEQGQRSLARQTWSDPSTQMFLMRTYLGAPERKEYAAVPAAGQSRWLLTRIAAKDAARRHLWDRAEAGALFPAELRVSDEGPGRVSITGVHRSLPRLQVRLSVSDTEVSAEVTGSRPAPAALAEGAQA